MFRIRVILASLLFLSASCAAWAQAPADLQASGSVDVLLAKYQTFKADLIRRGKADVLEVKLGYVKGLSRSFVGAAGGVSIDLASGKFVAALSGLEPGQAYSLWLMDRYEPQDGGDRLFNDARFVKLADVSGARAVVSGLLGMQMPVDFSLDRIQLLRGSDARGETVASGALNVFQKLFYRRLDATKGEGVPALRQSQEPRPALAHLIPDLARETLAAAALAGEAEFAVPEEGTPEVALATLISQGSALFFDGTFNGNGRTCGTCHPRSNNLTIDVPFIATLPQSDPLFVAENVPALAGLENPTLMRNFGLILENLDGFASPTTKFVMRSVPHTLGLQTSLAHDAALPSPPAQMTGWGGDGAPGAGSLRDFAVGAVTQHFTKRLVRIEGTDFKLPTENQLDAMEAFQLSLGRTADFDLISLVFTDAEVNAGKVIFRDGTGSSTAGGSCAACHFNAGATVGGQNRNFNTKVENVVHPGRALVPAQPFPFDGGFGQDLNPAGTFGNQTFNTPPVVEAADTAPFFHNNVVTTIEGVIAFYSGPVFNAGVPPEFQISFDTVQAARVAKFLRALNTLQNIQIARRPLQEIMDMNGNSKQEIDPRLDSAAFETADAIEVLNQGLIYPAVIPMLTSAQQSIAQAKLTNNKPANRALVQAAIDQLDAARVAIAP